jgi:hypothetical protein
VTLTTPEAGFNLTAPGKADNPGIDAGFVQYNLSLTKTLDTAGRSSGSAGHVHADARTTTARSRRSPAGRSPTCCPRS